MPWAAAAAIGGAVIGGVASNKAAKKAADAQDRATEANAYQGEIATDQYEEYKTTYRPLERALAADAANYDTQANRDKAAAEAQATVSAQMGLAADRLRRTPGLDPSSAAAQAATVNLGLKGAAIGAQAQNAAREGVRDKAYARKMDVVGLGKGLVTNASAGLANAASAAQSAANAQSASAASTAQGVGAAASGIISGIGKADWGKLGIGGGTTPSNPGADANGFVQWDAFNAANPPAGG